MRMLKLLILPLIVSSMITGQSIQSHSLHHLLLTHRLVTQPFCLPTLALTDSICHSSARHSPTLFSCSYSINTHRHPPILFFVLTRSLILSPTHRLVTLPLCFRAVIPSTLIVTQPFCFRTHALSDSLTQSSARHPPTLFSNSCAFLLPPPPLAE